jgi:Spy/CpxP family protein refolding chaperone
MEKTWKVVLAFVGVFIAGSVTGGLFTFRFAKKMEERRPVVSSVVPTPAIEQAQAEPPVTTPPASIPPGPVPAVQTPSVAPTTTPAVAPPPVTPANMAPPQFGPQLMRRFTEQLNLTREQRMKIRPIAARTEEELRRLRRDTQHQTEQVIERMQDEVAALLTPDQRGKFDELVFQARERVRRFLREQDQLAQKRRKEAQQQQMATPQK